MRRLINYKLLLLCPFLLAACSNEDETPSILPANQPDAVELGITAGVTLTKSVINSGNQTAADKDDVMKSVAVYARLNPSAAVSGEDPYTNAKGNNYALYTYSATAPAGWKSGNKKIYLTSEIAKIYAYYPAYQPGNDGVLATATALMLTGNAATDNSTIPVTIFPGTTDNADRDYPSLIDNSETTSTNKAKINSAKGEIDYMWADQTSALTASNGKATSSIDASVDLSMKHALSLVSFRIYNDGTYKNKGVLSKIQLKGVPSQARASGTPIATMNINLGTLTNDINTTATADFTREFTANYTLKKVGDASIGNDDAAKKASYRFSILVLPIAAKALNNTKAIFTIDGADYEVALAAGATPTVTWEQGKENIYTVKLSGKELSIGTVTVQAWGTGVTNDGLEVN